MTTERMSTLERVAAEMAAYDAARARSLQVETGASGIYGCRAQTLLRLSGMPASDPGVSWQALVGTAIHTLAATSAADAVLVDSSRQTLEQVVESLVAAVLARVAER